MAKYFLFFMLVLALCSCTPKPSQPINGDSIAAAAKKPGIPDFTKSFEGSIGGKYGILMTLTKSGNALTGTYSYKTHATPIQLKGTINEDGSLTLDGFDDKGNTCDNFKGTLQSNSITGTWSKPDGSKSMNFSVSESSNTEATYDDQAEANSWPGKYGFKFDEPAIEVEVELTRNGNGNPHIFYESANQWGCMADFEGDGTYDPATREFVFMQEGCTMKCSFTRDKKLQIESTTGDCSELHGPNCDFYLSLLDRKNK